MPETSYIFAVLAVVFVITFALRAVPFAMLKPLRNSKSVNLISLWMPAGILLILALSTLRSSVGEDPGNIWKALLAVAVTSIVHLVCGRRTLLSVGLGTATLILLLNLA